jgi:hypothetical protein
MPFLALGPVRRRSTRAIHWGILAAVLSLFAVGAMVLPAIAADGDVSLEIRVATPTPTPQPTISVPVEVPVDVPVAEAVFTISLEGLAPYSYIEIYANSTPVLIASGFADAAGVFRADVSLPPNLPPGDHSISATTTLSDGKKVTTTIVKFAVTESGLLAEPSDVEGGGGSGSGSSSGRGSAGPSTPSSITTESLGGSAASGYLGPDPFNLGGVFYMGRLTAVADYAKSGYASPSAKLEFAVRNVSPEVVPATAHFRVKNWLGMIVAEVPRYQFVGMESGETRLVTAVLHGIGQWGSYTADMVFTPPETVNGGESVSFRRDASFVAFSLSATVLALVISAGGIVTTIGYRYLGWRFGLSRKVQPGQDSLADRASPMKTRVTI